MSARNSGPRDGGLLVTENGARRRYASLPGIRPEVSEPVLAEPLADGSVRLVYTVSVNGVRIFDVEVDKDTGEVFLRNRNEVVIPARVSVALPSHIFDVYMLVGSSYSTLLTVAYLA